MTDRKKRPLWWFPAMGALLTLPCGAWALGEDVAPEAMTMNSLQPVFDREVAAFEALGLTKANEGVASMGDVVELRLEGGQCLGVVIASASAWPADLELEHDGVVVTRGDDGHVQAVAWCESLLTRFLVRFGDDHLLELLHTAQDRSGEIRYQILTGRTDQFSLLSLPRGNPLESLVREAVAQNDRDEASRIEARDLPDGALLDPVTMMSERGAVLFPNSPATYAALQVALSRGTPIAPSDVHPKVQHSSGGSSHPLLHLEEGLQRVVLVVDAADLPVEGDTVPCVEFRLGRLELGGTEMQRLHVPGFRSTPVSSENGVARDRVCPDDGLLLYTVLATDQADYRLRAYATEGGARRQPSAVPVAEVHPHLQALLDACTESNQCVGAARAFRDGSYTSPDPNRARELFRTSCAADVAACAEYAEGLLAERDEASDPVAASALESACPADPIACGRLGDLHRLGRGVPSDYEAAHELYRQACAGDVLAACQNAATLELLNMLSS